MLEFVLAAIKALFGSKVIWEGITVSQIISWLKSAEGKQATSVFGGVVKGLVQNGDSLAVAGLKVLAMVAKVHKMTPAEEKIWAERGMHAADANHDFPQNTGG